MIRLTILLIPTLAVFVGFSIPFLLPGGIGLLISAVVVLAGAAGMWFADSLTRKSLQSDTLWNQLMKAGDQAEPGSDKRER